MAILDDLISAKNALSACLLLSRKSAVAVRPARTIANARKSVTRNLHAVGVGYKIVSGKRTRTRCVRLYVVQKLAKSLIPREARLPKTIAGFPTDVIESPMARIHMPSCSQDRRRRLRPYVGGISAAHQAVVLKTTLGCFCHSVVRGEGEKLFMLGCNHGFANVNRGAPGDAIWQPGPGDGGTSADRIGRLSRFVPIQLGYSQNHVDAAISEVGSERNARNAICRIGPLTGIAPATEGMIVCKHGRTTGYTEGRVDDTALDAFVADYPGVGVGFAVFVNQIKIVPTLGYPAPPDEIQWDGWFAAPGDSGSVVVEKSSRKAVGLHFAGAYGISVANHLVDVCRLLKISIP